MNTNDLTRRRFIAAVSASSLAAVASQAIPAYANATQKAGKLAILGGDPVRKNKSWPRWPYWDERILDCIVKTT
jgi:hypothetical protein